MKIVIIDDEIKARVGLNKIISSHIGWEVVSVFDSSQNALEYLRNNHVDVVITDIRMPGITGLDLIAKLQTDISNVVFIVISGYELFEYAKRSIDLKVRKFLVKPVSPREVEEILGEVESELEGSEAIKRTPKVNNLIVSRAMEYINTHYKNKCSLKGAADELFVSPNYLSNLFKEKTGETFSEYLMNVRLEKSQEYLLDTKYKVSQVAELVGFTDYRYFCNAFKKKYTKTPTQYKNSCDICK